MILFHGTRATRRQLRTLWSEGLRAHPREWLHAMHPAENEFCFLASQPVAGIGGDPVYFAMQERSTQRGRDGWILVVDLPAHARDAIVAVLPNLDLEQFFVDQPVRESMGHSILSSNPRRRAPTMIEALVAIGRDTAACASLASTAAVRISRPHEITGEVSFAEWCRYVDALLAARSLAAVERAGKRWGIEWARPELVDCELCAHGLMTWGYPVPRGLGLHHEEFAALPAVVLGRVVDGAAWARLASRVSRWLPEIELAELHRRTTEWRSNARWADVFECLPFDTARVPGPWRPDFGRRFHPEDLRRSDVQLACRAIPPQYLRGAIHLARDRKLSREIRPAGDDTLRSRLWAAAHEILARYRDRPVLLGCA